jgi:multidrug transporter EmrE-like cation transporter
VPLDALALALAAAVVHALWNLLTARATESQVAAGVALAAGTFAFLPVALLSWDVRAGVAPYIAASAALELGYLVLLATAYQRAPLSVVYPLARGTAPVIVLAISVLGLGASLPAGAVLGVLAVGAGVLLVRGTSRERRGTLLGLAVAACIAGYTLVDNGGLDHAAPIPYLELVMIPTSVLYLAGAAALRGPRALVAELRPSVVVAGLAVIPEEVVHPGLPGG